MMPNEELFPLYKEPGVAPLPPGSLNYLKLSFGFLLVEQAFEFYLTYRQRKYLKKEQPPQDLLDQAALVDDASGRPSVEPPRPQLMRRAPEEDKKTGEPMKQRSFVAQLKEKFTSSKAYNLDKNTFSVWSSLYSLTTSCAALLGGLQPLFWTASSAFSTWVGLGTSELAVSACFLVMNSVVDAVISLPISLYSTFVLEEKHGFNKTTMKLFWVDKLKGMIIGNAITVPLMLAVTKLVRWGGEYFYLYVWVLLFVFSMAMLTIYPNFIMPLFNEYKPLEEGELRTEINKLAASINYPLKKLYEVDGSKRSSHSNAYLYGFWKDKRIVLFDTLMKNEKDPALECTTEEIVGILGHELGHWKMSHTLQNFVLQMGLSFATLKGFSHFVHSPNMYASFGLASQPVVIGLTLFFYVISPLGAVLGLALNALTRHFEFQADAFAVKLGKAQELKSGLLKISISNLSSFEVDPLYHAFTHSHPTLLQRLRTIDEERRALKTE